MKGWIGTLSKETETTKRNEMKILKLNIWNKNGGWCKRNLSCVRQNFSTEGSHGSFPSLSSGWWPAWYVWADGSEENHERIILWKKQNDWDPREAPKWLKSPTKIASVSEGTEAAKMLPCTERIWETWANRSFVTNLRYDTAVVLSCLSHVRLFSTLWTVACQAPLSMGFSRQEYWSELPCPPPGDLPDPWIEPKSLRSPVLAGGLFTTSTAWEALIQQRAVQNSRQLEDVKTSQQKPFWK